MEGTGYKRTDRIGDLILREISGMILKGEIKDPRVGAVILTGIKVADDIGFARVYFTLMTGKDEREQALKGLESAAGFMKRELGRRLRLRRVPDFKFEFDTALEEGYKIDDLLRGVSVERTREDS